MKDKHLFSYSGYSLVFEFEAFLISFPKFIPIEIMDEIRQNEEYQFLTRCLYQKHSFEYNFFDGNIRYYLSLMDEYRHRYST